MSDVPSSLPDWACEMRDLFKSGSVAQFILHGNVFDVVPTDDGGTKRLLPLKAFLDEVMFRGYDVVLQYDRGKGIRATKGADDWGDWLQQMGGSEALTLAQVREPGKALELIDRYLLRTLNLRAAGGAGSKAGQAPQPSARRKVAVMIEFAEFVVPRGDPIQLTGHYSANVVKVLAWANDPAIMQANIATVLITEGLHDLNELVVENPHSSKLKIELPDE